jgi:hypothetical protein
MIPLDASTSTRTSTRSSAERRVREAASRIGLEDAALLDTVCTKMRQEFVVQAWQLPALEWSQWKSLQAPIGLAAAVRQLSTTATATNTTTTMSSSSSLDQEASVWTRSDGNAGPEQGTSTTLSLSQVNKQSSLARKKSHDNHTLGAIGDSEEQVFVDNDDDDQSPQVDQESLVASDTEEAAAAAETMWNDVGGSRTRPTSKTSELEADLVQYVGKGANGQIPMNAHFYHTLVLIANQLMQDCHPPTTSKDTATTTTTTTTTTSPEDKNLERKQPRRRSVSPPPPPPHHRHDGLRRSSHPNHHRQTADSIQSTLRIPNYRHHHQQQQQPQPQPQLSVQENDEPTVKVSNVRVRARTQTKRNHKTDDNRRLSSVSSSAPPAVRALASPWTSRRKSTGTLFCSVLFCCVLLCSIVLYCIVLYCIVLCCVVLVYCEVVATILGLAP